MALRRLVNQQQREPFAVHLGKGAASSSDGSSSKLQVSAAMPHA